MKIISIVIALIVVSCNEIQHSEDQYEEGRVIYMRYDPPRTEIYPTIDFEGNVEINVDDIPEKYVIKFSCEHGEFEISNGHSKELFYNFRVGDEVIITYRQMDSVKIKDGVEIERHFYDWDFVTAKKLDRNGPKEQ